METTYAIEYEKLSFTIKIIGYAEPNNGRSLWETDILVDGVNRNNLFYSKHNYLNQNLSNYVFSSENGKIIFVPAEGVSFIVGLPELELFYLTQVNLSTIKFIGNVFVNEKLIVVYSDLIQIVSLNTKPYKEENLRFDTIKSYRITSDTLILNFVNNSQKEMVI